MIGLGATADMHWRNDNCLYGSYATISVNEGTSIKDGSSYDDIGTFVHGYYEAWHECNEERIKHTYFTVQYTKPAVTRS